MSEMDRTVKGCLRNIPGYINYLYRGYYVPKELEKAMEAGEDLILHLSDTPSHAYRSAIGLIETLKPRIIIHTGDLADDIKLEISPDLQNLFMEKALPFLRELENSSAEEIYIVPGNHDLASTLRKAARRSIIVPDGTVIEVMGRKIGLAHSYENLPDTVDYKLYGHNLDCPLEGNACSLNGCKNINIILYPSWRIYEIPYQVGTNHERQYNLLSGRLI